MPAFGLVNARELNHYDATRPPISFENLDPASTNDILTTIL